MARELNVGVAIHRMTGWLMRFAALLLAAAASAQEVQIDIPGPAGSSGFGSGVTVLPNGNIVVTDPGASGAMPNVGAVYLYSPTGVLISTLTGRLEDDLVGSGGVTVLRNGNYVVISPGLDRGSFQAPDFVPNVGAVTWVNGSTGLSGVVWELNSLIGATLDDQVGSGGVTALSNGNYVVSSPFLDPPLTAPFADVGGVTWANGSTGLSGTVSNGNTMTGTTNLEFVGDGGVTALSNGNYVFASPLWSGTKGAVTWANGSTTLSGIVSPANSLVGTTPGDGVGYHGVTALSNGNYVVASAGWNSATATDVGAVTWADGSAGLSGAVSPANSLIGTTPGDQVGSRGVTALRNGNYVVASSLWNKEATASAAAVGAVTWANGDTGLSGAVSPANSLIGTTMYDSVGTNGVTALSNGNYVVASAFWNSATATDVGAVTWADGSAGLSGAVSPANSLIGSTPGDSVGFRGVTALSNGNYVVASPIWNNDGIPDTGAVTWADGSTGLTGMVSPANSLIGSQTSAQVGHDGVTALINGNYVVRSSTWDNGVIANAGAVTWANGSAGLSGVVSTANSLIGAFTADLVGNSGVIALSNGNYVVLSPSWNNVATADVGAVTWADGNTGLSGSVSPANSLIGTTTTDQVGDFGVTALTDGNYVVRSSQWDNGATVDAGAVTLALGDIGLTGNILAANSVRGTAANAGTMSFGYDAAREQLVVGRPASNIVSLFRLSTDLIFTNGFE